MRTGDLGLPEPGQKQAAPPPRPPPPSFDNAQDIPLPAPLPAPELRKESEPLIFHVKLTKTPTLAKVGLDVDHGDTETLEVMMVKEGLVKKYNEGVPKEKQVQTGDRIVQVNGVPAEKQVQTGDRIVQ